MCPQVGIFPWSRPMPHTHANIGQGGVLPSLASILNIIHTHADNPEGGIIPLGSVSGHTKAVHDALAIAVSSLTMDMGCRAYRNASQAIPTATKTKVLFNAVNYNIGGAWRTGSGDFLAPSDGYYLFIVNLNYENIDDGKWIRAYIYRGATQLAISKTMNSAFTFRSVALISALNLNTNDVIEIKTEHNQGANKNVLGNDYDTYVCIHKLGV